VHEPIDLIPEKALVLFSGGQDSATCLAWALARFATVETIGFDYRQRHRIELDCRVAIIARLRGAFPAWNRKLGADHIVDLGVLGEATLSLGMDHRFVIHTPLMWRDKAATWALADALGGDALVELIVEETHSCYLGDRSHRHPWGYGCGQCPACELRGRGWRAFAGVTA